MSPAGTDRPVVALGRNALRSRGEPLGAANQAREARDAALILSPDLVRHQLVITLGNGPTYLRLPDRRAITVGREVPL